MSFQKFGNLANSFNPPERTEFRNLIDTTGARELEASKITDPEQAATAITLAHPNVLIEADSTYVYGHIRRDQASGTYNIGEGPYPFSTIYYDTLNNSSDRRKKRKIKKLRQGLAFIKALRPVRYKWKKSYSYDRREKWGFIAQDVELLTAEGPVQRDGDSISLDYTQIVPALVLAVQELAAEVEALRKSG